MKFFNIFAVFMTMILAVFALQEDTKKACPSTGVTFEQCINQYGGYQPTETTCASKASIGDEYNRCLALAYYNLSQCFGHCPNHPSKATYENFFQQYKQYYTPVVATATPTDANQGAASPSSTQGFDLNAEANGSTMMNAFSLSALLCMVAYWLF